jgi:hypothetical protein
LTSSTRRTKERGSWSKHLTEGSIVTSKVHMVRGLDQGTDPLSEGDLEGARMWNGVAGDLSQCLRDGVKYSARVSQTLQERWKQSLNQQMQDQDRYVESSRPS